MQAEIKYGRRTSTKVGELDAELRVKLDSIV
jgi:hypothetical protein